jgi:glutamate-1-semialdehyde 2,1-aminomutase
VRKMQQIDVPAHAAAIGSQLREGLQGIAARESVPLKISGYPVMTYFSFDHPEALALQTLWTVRMLPLGFLASGAFYPSLAHTSQHVDRYLAAAEKVFAELGQAVRQGDVLSRIGGPVRHSGFARLA